MSGTFDALSRLFSGLSRGLHRREGSGNGIVGRGVGENGGGERGARSVGGVGHGPHDTATTPLRYYRASHREGFGHSYSGTELSGLGGVGRGVAYSEVPQGEVVEGSLHPVPPTSIVV